MTATYPPNLRPLDVFHDLRDVAQLIQTCFNLDADGLRFVMHLRRAADSPAYLYRLALSPERAALPIMGFVWEQDGRIVGNIHLIRAPGAIRRYLIANVAVAPEFRRRGIARHLLSAALDLARRKRAREVWLLVEQANRGAQALYRAFGFRVVAARTTWLRPAHAPRLAPPPAVQVRPRRRSDWPIQRRWLQALYPTHLRWYLPLDEGALPPGWLARLRRILSGLPSLRHWAAWQQDRLLALLTWQPSHRSADTLWLAAPPDMPPEALPALIHALDRARHFPRPLRLDLPVHLHADALQAAGFTPTETLYWMCLSA